MMIDKIGGINSLNNVQNTHRTNGTDNVSAGTDSINVSEEAKEMAEVYYMKQVAANTPDVRADRVAEIREKIKDPSYLNDAVINSTADRIMTSFGL
jgi:flagellar biosynthesis anti-sigma factor FlgM